MIRHCFLSALTDTFSLTVSLKSFLPWFPTILSFRLMESGFNIIIHQSVGALSLFQFLCCCFLNEALGFLLDLTSHYPDDVSFGCLEYLYLNWEVTKLFPLLDGLVHLSRFSCSCPAMNALMVLGPPFWVCITLVWAYWTLPLVEELGYSSVIHPWDDFLNWELTLCREVLS